MMFGALQSLYVPSENIRKCVGLTMFGVTTPCIEQVTQALDADYDLMVFHATGSGGHSMEKLALEGKLTGILDITTTEIADLLFGGVLACSSERLDVVAATKLPYVGSCGALDMVNFWNESQLPSRYKHRQFYVHNANVTLMRTTQEECAELGRWIGSKLNKCHGAVRFLIPMGGFSALDFPGQPFYSPDCVKAFTQAIESTLVQTPERKLIKSPYHINDKAFSKLIVDNFYAICGGTYCVTAPKHASNIEE